MIIRALKGVWWAITWLFGWLWFIISWPFKKLCCCFKPRYEPLDIDSDEDSGSDSDFDSDERVTDNQGYTPRNAENRIDELLNAIAPEVRERLMRDYALQNRRPPLVPAQRTSSAPAEMQTERRATNEAEILEKREHQENN
jgi:hypothetical protein